MDWYSLKLLVVEQTGLSRDALHILVGFGGQLLVALLIRRPLSHPFPWFAVLVCELGNEAYDLLRETYWHEPMWPGSVRDVTATMVLPTALLLLSRFTPGILADYRRSSP